jgi:hypothetical protein
LDFFETKGYPLILILTLVVRSNYGGAPSGLTVAGYPYSKVVPWLLTGGGSNLLYEALFLTRFLPMVSQRRDTTVLQPFGGGDDRRRAGDGGTGSFTAAQPARG